MVRTLFRLWKRPCYPYSLTIPIHLTNTSNNIQEILNIFKLNILTFRQLNTISTDSHALENDNTGILAGPISDPKKKSKTKSKANTKAKIKRITAKRKKVNRNLMKMKKEQVVSQTSGLSLENYLQDAKLRGSSTDSTVFLGTFYELNFMNFLQKNFTVDRIIHQGGKDDKGIDIRATWHPVDDFEVISGKEPIKKFAIVNSISRVKPIVLKKSRLVKLFIQCKSWKKSRIDARLIREVNGTFTNTGRSGSRPSTNSRTGTFLMIVCPTGFTRQGRMDFDRSLLPLMFVKFSRAKIRNLKQSPYDITNYNVGQFESFYCNPMAAALLKGLDWSDFMKHLEVKQI